MSTVQSQSFIIEAFSGHSAGCQSIVQLVDAFINRFDGQDHEASDEVQMLFMHLFAPGFGKGLNFSRLILASSNVGPSNHDDLML